MFCRAISEAVLQCPWAGMQKGALQWLVAHLLPINSLKANPAVALWAPLLCWGFQTCPVLTSTLLSVCWAASGAGLRTEFSPEAQQPLKSWLMAAGLDLRCTDLALVLLESLEWLCLGFSMRQNQETILHNPAVLGNKEVEVWSCHFSHQDSIAEGYFGKCFHFITGMFFCFSCSWLPAFPQPPPQLRDRHTWAAPFRRVSPGFIRARLKVSLFFKGALIKLLYTWVF